MGQSKNEKEKIEKNKIVRFIDNSRRLTVAVNSIEKTVIRISFCISENQSFQFLTFRKAKSSRLNCQILKSGLEERMNVFSQSASRAEADSGDDSELSLSLFREGSERTSFFWPNQKVYKPNSSSDKRNGLNWR